MEVFINELSIICPKSGSVNLLWCDLMDIIITDKQIEKILPRLNASAEQANDGIAIVDLRGTVRFVNSYWATMHECKTTDEMVGKHINTFHTKEQMRADMIPLMKEANHRDQLTDLIKYARNDGVAFGIQTKMFAIKDAEGNTIGLVLFAKDNIQNDTSQHHFNDHNIEPITADKPSKSDELKGYRDQVQKNIDDGRIEPVADVKAEAERTVTKQTAKIEKKEKLNKETAAKAEGLVKSCGETAAKAGEKLKGETGVKLNNKEYAKVINSSKSEAEEKVKSYVDEIAGLQKKLKAETEKRLKVQDKLNAKLAARAKRVAIARAKAKAKIEAYAEKTEQIRGEARSKAEAVGKAKSYADEIVGLQKKLKAETEKRLKVQDKLNAKLAARAKRVARARAKAKAKIEAYAKKTEQIRGEVEEEVASQKALSEAHIAKIAELEAEIEAKAKTFAEDIKQARAEAKLQAKFKAEAEEKIKASALQIDKLVAANEKHRNEIIRQTEAKDVLENLEQRIAQQIEQLPSTREKLEQEIAKCQQIEQRLVRQADKLAMSNRQPQQTSAEHVYVQQRKIDQDLLDITVEEKFYRTSLRDFYRVSFRHKWKMALFFFTVTIIVTAGTFLCAKVYQSEAKLLVRLGRESVVLDPIAATGQIIQTSQSRENEINSELEILNSRELIEKVVDSIGVEEFIKHPEARFSVNDVDSKIVEKAGRIFNNTVGTFRNFLKRFDIIEPVSDHDKAVLEVTKNLKIENPKNNNLLNISYKAKTPELAQRIVAKLIDLYLEKHIAVHQTPGSHQFFIQQSSHLKEKLVRAENELRNLKNATGISSIEKQKEIVLNQIGTLKQEIDDIEAELAFSTANVMALQKTLNDAPETLKEMVSEKANVSSLHAQFDVKREKFPDVLAELKAINDTEVKIKSLERELEIEEANYRKYSENLEQARIDHAMESEKISNISIVQSATFPLKPIRPRKLLNLLLGFLLGIFGAIGLAFFSEYLDHSIKTPEEAEEKLQLPALAYIPHMHAIFSKRFSPRIKRVKQFKAGDKTARKAPLKWNVSPRIMEHYDAFREQLLLSSNRSTGVPYVLAVMGCHRGGGVSTISANLAIILSQYGDGDVLLVDSNFCHPSIHQIFKANLSPGLTDVLRNGQSNGDVIQSLSTQNLHILSAGTKNGSNSDIINSDRFEKLLRSVKNSYRFVVVDVPALNEVGSAARLAALCDGVVLVVEAEKLRWEVAQRAKEDLVKSNANILGVVLNKRRFHIPGWLYRTL